MSRHARSWAQFRAVVHKEVRQTVRDKRVMALLTVAPIMQLVLLGFAANFDVVDVPLLVVDRDQSALSRELARGLASSGVLTHRASRLDEDAAQGQLEAGHTGAVLALPRGLAREAERSSGGRLQVMVDGADPIRTSVAVDATSRFVAHRAAEMLRRHGEARGLGPGAGTLDLETRVLFNPRMETAVFVVPGVAAMLLLIVTTIVMAMGLARERETGTLEQLQVTPIPSWLLMAGKLAPFVVIGLVNLALALAAGAWIFGVPLHGDLSVVLVATCFYLLSTLGTGLLIATLSRTQQQAFLGGFLFVLPAVLLSGVLTPISSMPSWLRPITYLNPVRYFVEVVRGVLLRHGGYAELWPQLAALLVFGLVVIGAATARFRAQSI